MAKQLELRRGTTQANNLFTGVVGEVTMDTDTKQLRVHDGVKTGGYAVDTLVAFQAPSAGNNYTWYRKYASGWIEQGWRQTWSGAWTTVTLPVPMADANYTCTAGGYRTDSSPYQQMTSFRNYTTTTVDMWSSDDTSSNPAEVRVLVVGMAA